MRENLKNVTVYTDGGCISNPGGNGGYGVVLLYNNYRKELSGGFRNTTNNRMELMAAIKGLEVLKERCDVTIYSDSKYLVDAIELGWVIKWKNNGWMRTKKEAAKNVDLWVKLLNLLEKHEVKFKWVKGHSGNIENERCDYLASEAALSSTLEEDFIETYDNPQFELFRDI